MEKLKAIGHSIRANTRAAVRFALGFGILLPITLVGSLIQAYIVGPLTGNYTTFPRFVYNQARRAFGVQVGFKGAALDTGKRVWYAPNHLSTFDFLTVGHKMPTSFVMKGDILTWPVISTMAKAARLIGVHRSQSIRKLLNEDGAEKTPEQMKADRELAKKKFAQDMGLIMETFNRGENLTTFFEGTTTRGEEVLRFSSGFLSALFNAKGLDKKGNEVTLKEKVYVQPLAMRVKSVDGKNVSRDRSKLKKSWDPYTMYDENNILKRMWKRAKYGKIVLEVTVFDPLDPADFNDHHELANKAQELVTSVIAPKQQSARKPAEYIAEQIAIQEAAAKKKPAVQKKPAVKKPAKASGTKPAPAV